MKMDVLKYSELRANLTRVMDRVVNDHTPVVVTRKRAESVVMVSLADWGALDETLHLISTPANADDLRGAIGEIEAGKGIEFGIPTST
jgi:antitoxin YefM